MTENRTLKSAGEIELIHIIETLITESTNKQLMRDDAFFFSLSPPKKEFESSSNTLVLNSDMFVSTTDAPPQMTPYQMGSKAVIMNISDLIVKGVRPRAIVLSLGLPEDMKVIKFKELMQGIVDTSKQFDLDYIGGDMNSTKEIVINPTVFGFQEKEKIITREGLKIGDLVVANGKFGLTGIGFDLLLHHPRPQEIMKKYEKAMESVLEPSILGTHAYDLAENGLAHTSIDSSDGLAKSLYDLIEANPTIKNVGFEIEDTDDLYDPLVLEYVKESRTSLEQLIFYAGEEFVHIFTISPEVFSKMEDLLKKEGKCLYLLGKVIEKRGIFFKKKDDIVHIKEKGYEHFTER